MTDKQRTRDRKEGKIRRQKQKRRISIEKNQKEQRGQMYRVVRSRLTHFKFEYCAGAIACPAWREEER